MPNIGFQLPAEISCRYPKLQESLTEFLSGLESCVSPSETEWFLCQSDYEGRSGAAFRWNEWEELGIQAARDSRDAKWEQQIRGFWDKYFPFMLSVANGCYSYTAVCVAPTDFGRIVQGHEPQFEEPTIIADGFEQFIEALVNERGRSN